LTSSTITYNLGIKHCTPPRQGFH